jgi:N-acyl-D-amino-acid deacylase|tara:strand:+ start:439 stop:1935 length:1497 start_codon:yes stop_codon:yes gene_type:complete
LLELVIKGATVIDGSGVEGAALDVGIEGDRIAMISPLIEVESAEILNATGLTLTPGFIDVHSHDDFHVLIEPEVRHNIFQGITTAIVGNCGFGAAGSDAGKVQMKAINEPSAELPDWTGYAGYMEEVDKTSPVLNVAALIGHHTARREAMDGVENRPPTDAELAAMLANVAEGMEAGAVGMSTGLVYEPGRYAATEEIVSLAQVVGKHDGLYVSHMRDEGGGLLDSVRETLQIGETSGTGVEISHHKAVGRANWGKVVQSLEMIEDAVAQGRDVTADQYPYTARSTMLFALVQNGTFSLGEGGAMGKSSPEEVLLCSVPGQPEFEGRTLQSFVEEFDLPGEDAAKKLLSDISSDILVAAFGMDEGDVRMVMAHSSTMIGTDGLDRGSKPHPRAWGTYPRVLGKYVREEGVISLENAIYKMTHMPATKFNIANRGLIKEGYFADLTLFDPETVIDGATYENSRVGPQGLLHVIVNGQFAVRDGKHSGSRSGRTVRMGQM